MTIKKESDTLDFSTTIQKEIGKERREIVGMIEGMKGSVSNAYDDGRETAFMVIQEFINKR